MGLRMAGTAVAAVATVAAIFVFTSPQAAVGAPKGPTLVVTERFAVPVLTNVAPGSLGHSEVSCSPGEQVTGGGFHFGQYDSGSDDFAQLIGQDGAVFRSSQYGPQSWRVSVLNTGSLSFDLRATVMCAKIQ